MEKDSVAYVLRLGHAEDMRIGRRQELREYENGEHEKCAHCNAGHKPQFVVMWEGLTMTHRVLVHDGDEARMMAETLVRSGRRASWGTY
jgi:hypothetical protein